MAIVGTYANLDEVGKLTQDVLVQGIIETFIRYNPLLARLPVTMLDGPSHEFNVEKEWEESRAATQYTAGDRLADTADVDYEQVRFSLKRAYRSQKLDNFTGANWSNINDLRANAVRTLAKRMAAYLEDAFIYQHPDVSTLNFGGLHSQIAMNPNLRGATIAADDHAFDAGGNALSIGMLRDAVESMEMEGTDAAPFIYIPTKIRNRLNAAYEEAGIRNNLGNSIRFSPMAATVPTDRSQVGRPLMMWDGIELVVTNYLKQEAYSGTKDSQVTTGTGNYSIFIINPGQIADEGGDGGLQLYFGSRDVEGQTVENEVGLPVYHDSLPKLEDEDAGRERMFVYANMAHDLPRSIVRIHNIANEAITI